LIALSGGAGSTALLDLLTSRGYVGREGKEVDIKKGEKEWIWERGTVVYVEFCGVTGGEERTGIMRGMAEERGLDFVGLRVEDAFDPTLEQRLGKPMTSQKAVEVDLHHPGKLSPCCSTE
jgi:cytoplasmic tRNA 2-thiolation protein 2